MDRNKEEAPKEKAGGSFGNDRPISVSARSCSVDTGPPRREDETEQIESSHKDARCLLEPDPRGAGKRGKDQDIRGYHNTGESDLMTLVLQLPMS